MDLTVGEDILENVARDLMSITPLVFERYVESGIDALTGDKFADGTPRFLHHILSGGKHSVVYKAIYLA